MIDLKTEYAGLKLRNPLIAGSSGLTNNPERNKEFEKAIPASIVFFACHGLDTCLCFIWIFHKNQYWFPSVS